MSENSISLDIKESDVVEITKAIQVLAEKLQPLLIALSAADKQALAKMKEASIPFMDKIIQYLDEKPEFAASYLDKEEVKRDYRAFTLLNSFLRPLAQITRNLDDTAVLCGSEAYAGGRSYYKTTAHAVEMNVPGAKAVYDDLKVRFEQQKAKTKKAEPVK
jgi:hypothetical protein